MPLLTQYASFFETGSFNPAHGALSASWHVFGAAKHPPRSTDHNVPPHSFLAAAQRSKLARKECGAALGKGASREVGAKRG